MNNICTSVGLNSPASEYCRYDTKAVTTISYMAVCHNVQIHSKPGTVNGRLELCLHCCIFFLSYFCSSIVKCMFQFYRISRNNFKQQKMSKFKACLNGYIRI